MFESFDIAATWATVGFLFATSRDDLARYRPRVLPHYDTSALDPYRQAVGETEDVDPLHFANDIVLQIHATPRQEVASHTYSHFYCFDDRAGPTAFEADIASALAIARANGIELRSIVFPRNQVKFEYLEILSDMGITAYRGNARNWEDAEQAKRPIAHGARLVRLLDAYSPFGRPRTYSWRSVVDERGMANVRASHFLRPFVPGAPGLEALKHNRVMKQLRDAAANHRVFHLWWHPHNFAVNQQANIALVSRIAREAATLRQQHGLRSLTMREAADYARRAAR